MPKATSSSIESITKNRVGNDENVASDGAIELNRWTKRGLWLWKSDQRVATTTTR